MSDWILYYQKDKDNITEARTKNKKYRIIYPGQIDNDQYLVMLKEDNVRPFTYILLDKFVSLKEAKLFVERIEMNIECLDCHLPYEEFGLDMTLPDNQWLMIHPEDGGLLCANCIVKRAEILQGAIAVRAEIELTQEVSDD